MRCHFSKRFFLRIFKLSVFIEDFFIAFHFGIYFYKWAIDFQIRFLWFDIYFMIGRVK